MLIKIQYTPDNHIDINHVIKDYLKLNYPDTSLISNSLETCTCGGFYYFAESLSMSFTLPLTRLILFAS